MATTGVVSGTLMRVYLDSVAVAKATNCTISLQSEMREIVHKDNDSAWAAPVPGGQKSGTATTDALYAEGDTLETLFAAMDADTLMVLKYQTAVSGDKHFTCNCYIESLEMNAPVNESTSYTASFRLSGQPTRDTTA